MIGIKNLKMPKSCLECIFSSSEEGSDCAPCLLTDENVFEHYLDRASTCPLIEVEDKMIIRTSVYLCNSPSGNKYCDYTREERPRQCNYEKRCGASFLDCKHCIPTEEITKVNIK